MMKITINQNDIAEIRTMLRQIKDEAPKAVVRAINETMPGVRTDGTKLLSDHYALTAPSIRESWKINKAKFRDPHGVVSTAGTFIRLINYGAKQTKTGVSVKILKAGKRKVIKHAFISTVRKDQSNKQVYWRTYKGPHSKPVSNRAYAKMPLKYRVPVEALYGPRIQDYLGDPYVMSMLTKMTEERLSKNMRRAIESILRGF